MGQYYKPAVLDDSKKRPLAWVYSHDIKVKYTREDGQSFMMGNGLKLMEHSWMNNKFVQAIENLLIPGGSWHKQPIVWAGDYADNEPDTDINIYGMLEDEIKIIPTKRTLKKKYKYIVNHTKMKYVDKTKVPLDNDGWQIHPLPLLTCEGNGRGGGDFRGDETVVGTWARDIISVEETVPEFFTELNFNLTE